MRPSIMLATGHALSNEVYIHKRVPCVNIHGAIFAAFFLSLVIVACIPYIIALFQPLQAALCGMASLQLVATTPRSPSRRIVRKSSSEETFGPPDGERAPTTKDGMPAPKAKNRRKSGGEPINSQTYVQTMS